MFFPPSVSTITLDHRSESARSVATRFQRSLFAPRFVSMRTSSACCQVRLGISASVPAEVGLGQLEIEHRLALGLVFGIDDLAGLSLVTFPRLVRLPVLESAQ